VVEEAWSGRVFWAMLKVARFGAAAAVGLLLLRGSGRQRLLALWLLLAIAPYTVRATMFPRYAYPATALFAVLAAQLAGDFLRRRPARAGLLRAGIWAFVAVNLALVYASPSVAAFKGYAREARPIVAEVCRLRAEMAPAAELWLIDPPAFAPPGRRTEDRMWVQIAQLVHDRHIPTRTLRWPEWQTTVAEGRVPAGVQAYRWDGRELRQVR
jgi:hypothetical protein